MGKFNSYAGGDMTVRPVYEEAMGSWPGTVSPADAFREQFAGQQDAPEVQSWRPQLQPQHFALVAEAATKFDELDPRQN